MNKTSLYNGFLRVLRIVFLFLLFHFPFLTSQAQSIRETFKAMPDSLMPYLSTNNRLDMMDFMDAKMKAKVTNMLDGQSEMVFLDNDSLCIRMSEALTVEMKMQKKDTASVVCLKRTYLTHVGADSSASQLSCPRQVTVSCYDPVTWAELSSAIVESTLLRRDEKIKDL